jgi:hypothetical protein
LGGLIPSLTRPLAWSDLKPNQQAGWRAASFAALRNIEDMRERAAQVCEDPYGCAANEYPTVWDIAEGIAAAIRALPLTTEAAHE